VLPAGSNYMEFGNACADEILANGGAELMAQIKHQLKK